VQPKAAAILTILRAADMTPKGKFDIARWLRREARFLTVHGCDMADRFTDRYLYDPSTDLRNSRSERRKLAKKRK